MANYQQDYDEIKAMQQKASSATRAAGVYSGGASTFEDQVMQGVQAHRAERGASSLTQDLGNVTGQLASYGPEARERMGDVVNPLEADVVTGRERGDLLNQLSTISSLMSEQEGTVEEVIGAGANKLLAAAEKKKAEAMQAESEANMLLQLVQTKQAEAQREAQRLMAEEELQLSKDKFEYDKTTGSGGGEGDIGINALASQLVYFKSGSQEYFEFLNSIPANMRAKVVAKAKQLRDKEKAKEQQANNQKQTQKKEKSRTINVKGKNILLPKNIDLSAQPFTTNQNRYASGSYW